MEKGCQGARGTHLIGQVLWEEEGGIWRLVGTTVQSPVPEASEGAQLRRGLLGAKGRKGRSQSTVTVTQPG